MSDTSHARPPLWYQIASHARVLGTPAPVFPGYEIELTDPVADAGRQDAIWHRQRARAILRAHPEIKQLHGRNPATAAWCLLFAAAQVLLAVALSQQSLWLVLLMSYVVGSWINMCLFNLAHDCNHGLVFRRNLANVGLFTITSLPMFLPGHHTWWIEHHVHHNDLGSRKDFVKRRRNFLALTRSRVLLFIKDGPLYKLLTAFSTPLFHPYSLLLVITQFFRTAIGLVMYAVQLLCLRIRPGRFTLAVLSDEHLVTAYYRYKLELWAVIYPILSFTLVAWLWWVGGWKAVLYLMLSQIFMTGFLHSVNFGLILSNSHFNEHDTYQPTSSYYGWLNRITFNFGLHTEHHDLSGIPWNRLPELSRRAPEFYETLEKTTSYSRLAWKFAFSRRPVFKTCFADEQSLGYFVAETPRDAVEQLSANSTEQDREAAASPR